MSIYSIANESILIKSIVERDYKYSSPLKKENKDPPHLNYYFKDNNTEFEKKNENEHINPNEENKKYFFKKEVENQSDFIEEIKYPTQSSHNKKDRIKNEEKILSIDSPIKLDEKANLEQIKMNAKTFINFFLSSSISIQEKIDKFMMLFKKASSIRCWYFILFY